MFKVCLRRNSQYVREFITSELPSPQTRQEARKGGFILDVFPFQATPLPRTFAQKQTRATFDRKAALYPVGPKNLSINEKLALVKQKPSKIELLKKRFNLTHQEATTILKLYERGTTNV